MSQRPPDDSPQQGQPQYPQQPQYPPYSAPSPPPPTQSQYPTYPQYAPPQYPQYPPQPQYPSQVQYPYPTSAPYAAAPPSPPPRQLPATNRLKPILLYCVLPLVVGLVVVSSILYVASPRLGLHFLAQTTTPTATPDPNAGWQAYDAFLAAEMQPVYQDEQQDAKDCTNTSDLNPCYTDMQTLDDDVHKVQQDLDTHSPTPPCLRDGVNYLRASLHELDQAAQEWMAAIRTLDAYTLDTADSHLRQATRDIQSSTTALRNAPCITPTSSS